MEKDAERDRDQSNHNRHSRRSFLVGASDTDAVCNRKNSVKYRRCRDASWIDGARRFFDVQKALGKIKPVIAACMLKLVGFTAVFLPFAVMLGFRREELIAILVMLGSATTVSCYVMAKNMGHEGTLTSGVVMLTTVFSAFTLTGWLFILKSMNLV